MRVIADTREQRPFPFAKYEAQVERAALPTADYSLPGFEDRVGIERKELGDLVGCLMGPNRERFEHELRRLSAYDLKAVVVEASMRDVADGLYRSEMKPHAVLQSVLTFQVRYAVPFLFCGDRAGAEYTTFWLLAKYAREIEERMKALTKAQAKTMMEPRPKARRLFPDADLGRKKDHGRADALLLAWWARRQGIGSG
jgi:ERCC4-type nuclease